MVEDARFGCQNALSRAKGLKIENIIFLTGVLAPAEVFSTLALSGRRCLLPPQSTLPTRRLTSVTFLRSISMRTISSRPLCAPSPLALTALHLSAKASSCSLNFPRMQVSGAQSDNTLLRIVCHSFGISHSPCG
ncbi:hypothetical protein AMTRI_Chr01g128750 [Amborella trichopoda]